MCRLPRLLSRQQYSSSMKTSDREIEMAPDVCRAVDTQQDRFRTTFDVLGRLQSVASLSARCWALAWLIPFYCPPYDQPPPPAS